MTDIEPDKVIGVEKATDILSRIEVESAELVIKDNSIKIKEKGNVVMEFISIRENPKLAVQQDKTTATISQWYIYFGSKLFEVDLDDPISISLDGLGIEQLQASNNK